MEPTDIDEKEMVTTMIAQHNGLRAEVEDMHERASDPSTNAEALYVEMQKFRKTLDEHLAIENDMFYPRLLERMEKRHTDVEPIKAFIGQMKAIGDQVFSFLAEYDSAEKIRMNPEGYRATLETMSSALMIRISTEEDSVYLYWNM